MNGYLPNWIFITVVFAKRLFSMLDNYLKRVLFSYEVFITIFYSQLGKCIANSFFNSEVIFASCSHRYLNVCLLFIDGNGLIRLDLTMQIKYILLLSVKEKMQYLGDCL